MSRLDDSGDESGYESTLSNTGPRDNPRCSNFEQNIPVRKVHNVNLGKLRHLNRKGRAICRIVHRHGWTFDKIGSIFRLPRGSIVRAVQNSYSPPDNVINDYKYADQEFRAKFPGPEEEEEEEEDNSDRSGSTEEHKNFRSNQQEAGSDSGEDKKRVVLRFKKDYAANSTLRTSSNNKRTRTQGSDAENSIRTTKKPRQARKKAAARHALTPEAPPADTLLAFLKDVMGLDMSKHLPLFTARGFENVDTLRTMAKWEKRHLQETLRRVLTGDEVDLGGKRGLTELELVSLEIAIRELQ
ncbi:hypothetical protein B0H13DRAFT_2056528 [Mycena leptocephala]|nr:hypothetical protein B0H13DRAFT_2102765 [Mycena leptocephala]KAJ7875640.1 hypothetical protein B0H13DRAFT_2056528 [Mycena leptocephala]